MLKQKDREVSFALEKGRYAARLAEADKDIEAAQRLRHLVFIETAGVAPRQDGRDADRFDSDCSHVLIKETRSGRLVCCFRLLMLRGGTEISRSYSAQYYGLAALRGFRGRMAEIGRFCIHPAFRDPDILRVAWGALARIVDAQGVAMLFGCSSFPGTEAGAYPDAFAMLRDRHLAPRRWRPAVKAPDVVRFARDPRAQPDTRRALQSMPPLLRTYLIMGGRVSDHAVVDRDMNTLHVFTGLEIKAIPPARARLLRAVAG